MTQMLLGVFGLLCLIRVSALPDLTVRAPLSVAVTPWQSGSITGCNVGNDDCITLSSFYPLWIASFETLVVNEGTTTYTFPSSHLVTSTSCNTKKEHVNYLTYELYQNFGQDTVENLQASASPLETRVQTGCVYDGRWIDGSSVDAIYRCSRDIQGLQPGWGTPYDDFCYWFDMTPYPEGFYTIAVSVWSGVAEESLENNMASWTFNYDQRREFLNDEAAGATVVSSTVYEDTLYSSDDHDWLLYEGVYCVNFIVEGAEIKLYDQGFQELDGSSVCTADATDYYVYVDTSNEDLPLDSPYSITQEYTDRCVASPCMELETESCISDYNGADPTFVICNCLAGFSGDRCQIDDDVCGLSGYGLLCQNGATCVEGYGLAYSCTCAFGFEGVHCEIDIDYCESECNWAINPKTGETSTESCDEGYGPAYTCYCDLDHVGNECQTALPACDLYDHNSCPGTRCELCDYSCLHRNDECILCVSHGLDQEACEAAPGCAVCDGNPDAYPVYNCTHEWDCDFGVYCDLDGARIATKLEEHDLGTAPIEITGKNCFIDDGLIRNAGWEVQEMNIDRIQYTKWFEGKYCCEIRGLVSYSEQCAYGCNYQRFNEHFISEDHEFETTCLSRCHPIVKTWPSDSCPDDPETFSYRLTLNAQEQDLDLSAKDCLIQDNGKIAGGFTLNLELLGRMCCQTRGMTDGSRCESGCGSSTVYSADNDYVLDTRTGQCYTNCFAN